jgi:hypothetical protein
MPRLYRITAIPKVADKFASQFTLDVILDENDMLADDDRPIFGMQGDVEGPYPDRYPVVIDSRGAIDFGSAYKGDDRKYPSNIRETKLSDGQQFTMQPNGYATQIYEITNRALLLGE